MHWGFSYIFKYQGELFDRLVEKGNFYEEEAAFIDKRLLSAVEYLHENNIVHRDIKVSICISF